MSRMTRISFVCGVLALAAGLITTLLTRQLIWLGVGAASMALGSVRVWAEKLNAPRDR